MSVAWYTDGRIIYDCPQGIITIETAQAASDAILALLDSQPDVSPNSIHLMIDMRQVEDFPRNLSSATQTLNYMRHPALGWTIMITANQVQRIFASVLAQVFRVRFKMVATLDEALSFLQRYDVTLAPLLPEMEKPEE
jgi:hypothetical protein